MKKPPASFWIINGILLLWNLMGVNQYFQQAFRTEAFKAMYTEEQFNMICNAPAWSTGAFALAVFGATLGSIAMLLRKKWAKTLFTISFIAIIIQMYYNFVIIDSIAVYGPGAMAMPVMIVILALFSIGYAKYAEKKKWLS